MKPWKDWTWDELATEAQTGTRGQGAVVEASRRLTERMDASSDCAATQNAQMIKLTNALRVYTIVLAVIGAIQIGLMIWKS